jgi:hypothetical protein
MKNIIFALFTLVAFSATAQHTTPRWGTGANNDNTFRAMTFKSVTVTDAAGLDTLKLAPNAYHTQVTVPSLVDSFAVNVTSVANSYLGDKIEITVINSGTGKCVKWAGANVSPATISGIGGGGSQLYITSSANKRGNIVFVFDGVKWVEEHRLAQ